MKELHSDLEELDNEDKNWLKRLQKSIGWVEPETEEYALVYRDKKGNYQVGSNDTESKIVWEVNMPGGSQFTCDKQIEAELLSYIVQINERLKRMEEKYDRDKILQRKGK